MRTFGAFQADDGGGLFYGEVSRSADGAEVTVQHLAKPFWLGVERTSIAPRPLATTTRTPPNAERKCLRAR